MERPPVQTSLGPEPVAVLGSVVATGGGWMLLGELAAETRSGWPWRRLHAWLLPWAGAWCLGTLVAAHRGVPTALLAVMTVALGIGHFWPSWSARELAAHWTPVERYLRVSVGSEGIVLLSTGRSAQLRFRELEQVVRTRSGWLLSFRGQPSVWLASSWFAKSQEQRVADLLGGLGAERRVGGVGWLYVGVGVASLLGTALWHLTT